MRGFPVLAQLPQGFDLFEYSGFGVGLIHVAVYGQARLHFMALGQKAQGCDEFGRAGCGECAGDVWVQG